MLSTAEVLGTVAKGEWFTSVDLTTRLLSHVARLGLRVNLTKNCLVPSQSIVFLWASLDAVAMKACPSPQWVDDILRLLPLFREGRQLHYVEFLHLLEKLTAAATVVPLGLLSLHLVAACWCYSTSRNDHSTTIASPRNSLKSDIQIVCFLCIVLNTAKTVKDAHPSAPSLDNSDLL